MIITLSSFKSICRFLELTACKTSGRAMDYNLLINIIKNQRFLFCCQHKFNKIDSQYFQRSFLSTFDEETNARHQKIEIWNRKLDLDEGDKSTDQIRICLFTIWVERSEENHAQHFRKFHL